MSKHKSANEHAVKEKQLIVSNMTSICCFKIKIFNAVISLAMDHSKGKTHIGGIV
jgi:hypothetical protein